MKTIVYERYGSPDVLKLMYFVKPTPIDNDVLIKIVATTVTSADWRARSLSMPAGFGFLGRLFFGLLKPRQPILGTELAGDIVAVGKNVKKFKVGDRVFAFCGASMGCYTEYKCMSEEDTLALKPANLTYEEAAAMSFGGTTAIDVFRRGRLQPGERVLINGASGGVGTAAVQLAKYFGAEVTAVCSTENVRLVRDLGATHVIDYTKNDFSRNGQTYDVIVDIIGTAPYSRSKRSLAEGGRLLLVSGDLLDLLLAPWLSIISNKKIIAGPVVVRMAYLHLLAKLAETGHFKPVIDRSYPIEQIVDAHRYVDTRRKKGNVVILVAHDD